MKNISKEKYYIYKQEVNRRKNMFSNRSVNKKTSDVRKITLYAGK